MRNLIFDITYSRANSDRPCANTKFFMFRRPENFTSGENSTENLKRLP